MPTYTPKASEIERNWLIVDAEGLVLGRLATEVASILRGKHKPTYAPHIDTGDHVVIINCDKVVLTSGKAEKKKVFRHSGYPGGIKEQTFADLMEQEARRCRPRHHPRHAPEEPSRPGPAQEAEGLRRSQPSACRSAASGARAGPRPP